MKRSNTKEFTQKAHKIHGDDYIYDKVKYINAGTKVSIICPKHGEFTQPPYRHLSGHGCSKCGIESRTNLNKSSTREFIQKAQEVHGNDYIYNKVKYIDSSTKVTIICPKHGVFEQRPNNHLNGQGCYKCGTESMVDLQRSSTLKFTQKSQEVHDSKYIYDKVDYVDSSTKVIIICPMHGEFTQTPHNHLIGQGCPKCNTSKQELFIADFLKESDINFKWHKTFNNCINPKTGHNFEYDFYLPDINTLLEFDGVFHYKQVYNTHNLKKQKLHDRYKDMWAHKNGFELIRISYKDNLEFELQKLICSIP